MCMCISSVLVFERPEEDIGFLGPQLQTIVAGMWKGGNNPRPLQEQQMILTTESSTPAPT